MSPKSYARAWQLFDEHNLFVDESELIRRETILRWIIANRAALKITPKKAERLAVSPAKAYELWSQENINQRSKGRKKESMSGTISEGEAFKAGQSLFS